MNDNDQVVPSMSTKEADPLPVPVSRKRRRSSDKLLNNLSQRGITVEHVGSDARQVSFDQLQQLFRSNRNRLNNLALSETVRSTTPSLYSYSPGANHLATSPATLRHFSNRNNQWNVSNGDRQTVSSNAFSPRISRQGNGTSPLHPNWRFLRLGNTMLNDLFRNSVIGSNLNASTPNRQNEQMRMIRRIRRTQPSAPNQNGR